MKNPMSSLLVFYTRLDGSGFFPSLLSRPFSFRGRRHRSRFRRYIHPPFLPSFSDSVSRLIEGIEAADTAAILNHIG